MSVQAERPDSAQAPIHESPDTGLRRVVNGLSRLRIAAGPPLAAQLLKTDSEGRSWAEGAIAASIAITDKLDGIAAGVIGPTDYGRDLDRAADRSFVIPQQAALAAKGEIPPIHFGLKVSRELAMHGLRSWGAKHGKNLKSSHVNRQKTTFEMATITAAHSPLAQNEELLRWGASAGTALSLTGLIETAFDYMKKDEAEEVTTARNSSARAATTGPRDKLAAFIDNRFPGITPNHITHAGKRLVEIASATALLRADNPLVPTVLYTVGSLSDILDGPLARHKGEDSVDGMIEDVQADLEQQLAAFSALSLIASRRGNRVAAENYALATMLTPLSALNRAEAESKGLLVAEGGMGTRLGRGILGGVGMAFNKHRDTSDIVSATLAAGTVNTVLERRDVVAHGTDSEYCIGTNMDETLIDEAEQRYDAIMPYAVAGINIGRVLLAASRASKPTKN